MNKDIMRAAGFGFEVAQVEQGKCPFCGCIPGPWRDVISEREFFISGLCQECQDKTFGENEGEDR